MAVLSRDSDSEIHPLCSRSVTEILGRGFQKLHLDRCFGLDPWGSLVPVRLRYSLGGALNLESNVPLNTASIRWRGDSHCLRVDMPANFRSAPIRGFCRRLALLSRSSAIVLGAGRYDGDVELVILCIAAATLICVSQAKENTGFNLDTVIRNSNDWL